MKNIKYLFFIFPLIAILVAMKKTIKITLRRIILEDNRTIGKLYVEDTYFCDTLEDTYRGQDLTNTKVWSATAIPNGIYQVINSFSPKFQKVLPEILHVPFFTGIRIHTGASEYDTSGCILVGDYNNGIWKSNVSYVTKLVNYLANNNAIIQIMIV